MGIDPGLRNFGYAIIEFGETQELICAGEISTEKDDVNRLAKIYNAMCDLIKSYNPDLCVIERTFMNKNPFSSINLGQARGVFLLAFQMFDKPYLEVAPSKIKKSVCGSGLADKKQIQSYVQGLFNVSLGPNAADAVAICLCVEREDLLQNKKLKQSKKNL